MPPVAEVTASLGVVRFHGRNKENWEKKETATSDRFNYLYTDAELEEWLPKIRRMAKQAEALHLLFKNKAHDFPVRNAERMRQLLERVPSPLDSLCLPKDPLVVRQAHHER